MLSWAHSRGAGNFHKFPEVLLTGFLHIYTENVMANASVVIYQTNEYFFHLGSIKMFYYNRKLSYEIHMTAVKVEVL